MLQSIWKYPFEVIPIMTVIFSLPIRSIFWKFTHIGISIGISFCPQPKFHRIFKFTFIAIPFLQDQNAKAFHFAIFPFTKIWVPIWTFPHPATIFFTVCPLAVVNFSVRPLKDALTFFEPLFEISLIDRTISKILISLAFFKIVRKVTFIWSPIEIKNNSFTFFLTSWGNLPKIDTIPIFLDIEVLHIDFSEKLALWFVVWCDPGCIIFREVYIDRMKGFFTCQHKVIGVCPYSNLSNFGCLGKPLLSITPFIVIFDRS